MALSGDHAAANKTRGYRRIFTLLWRRARLSTALMFAVSSPRANCARWTACIRRILCAGPAPGTRTGRPRGPSPGGRKGTILSKVQPSAFCHVRFQRFPASCLPVWSHSQNSSTLAIRRAFIRFAKA